jgi:hypothetical protein
MLAERDDDEQRGGIAALLLWSAGISPHSAKVVHQCERPRRRGDCL